MKLVVEVRGDHSECRVVSYYGECVTGSVFLLTAPGVLTHWAVAARLASRPARPRLDWTGG